MKAKEIFENLLKESICIFENTCDVLICGDENKEVKKIGTCFKLTAALIEEAKKQNVDMIITHEPTFAIADLKEYADEIELKKWKLLEDSNIVLYRYHDHAHHREKDYIHQGFIKALNLKIKKKYPNESLGVCRYDLDENITTNELAKRIKDKLGNEFVRIVGNDNYPLKTICLGLGSVGFNQIKVLINPGCDLFVTGEVGEVCIDEYVRDACFFNENKSVLILGHYGSEYSGMKLLAKELNEKVCETIFLDGKEVYHGIHD